MTVNDQVLTILVCSVSGERLRMMAPEEVASLNQRIQAEEVRNRSGQLAPGPIDGGLAADDTRVVYPIVNDLPYLLPEDGILYH